MQCPKCRKVISEASSSCPNCGHDLSLYHSIALMSDDLVKIKADAFALSKKIDLMQSRFVQLERQIPKHSPEDEFHLETQKESQSESGSAPKGHGQQMPAQKQERPVAPPPRPAGSRLESELRPTECGESEVKFGQKWLLIAGVILTVLADRKSVV